MVRSAKILLIVPALVSFLAIGAFAATTTTSTHPARLVYFILNGDAGLYSTSLQNALASARAHFPGISLTVMNAHGSASEQISDINAAISAGAKGIILEPVMDSVAVAARDAMTKGIPVFTVDRDLADASARMGFIGANEETVGRMETEYATTYLGSHGIPTPWNVAILQGTMTAPESAARLKGAMDVLKPLVDKGVVKIALNQSANFAAGTAQGMIRGYLADKGTGSLQLVVCASDAEALGAINALMSMSTGLGTRTFVVGANASPQGLENVRNGIQLDTVSHSPYIEAYWALEAMNDYLLHGTTPNAAKLARGDINIPVTLVTRSNAHSFNDWGTPPVITSLPYGPATSFRVSMK